MRERLKEIEEMKELERRAEELQAGEAEAEEEKRQNPEEAGEDPNMGCKWHKAKNRHKDCIALYRELESKHPSLSIRRQAADLRYIFRAPKLKISDYAGSWSDKYKDNSERKEITTNRI